MRWSVCAVASMAVASLGACAGGLDPGAPTGSISSTFGQVTLGSASDGSDDGLDPSTGDTDGHTSAQPTTDDPTLSSTASVSDSASASDSDTSGDATTGTPPGCGDGVIDPGEACDDGPANADTASCKSDCTPQICGDGFVGPGEGCDDGNVDESDECNNQCVPTSCGDGVMNGVESCDDGNADDSDGCPTTCQNASCGDGFVHAGVEQCDTGGQSAACDADCSNATCGDGYVNGAAGEACDDGNGSNGDGCVNCQTAFCGDGFVWSGNEQCDDGNGNSGDGCSAGCTNEFPAVCDGGLDPGTGSAYVVCAADGTTAWVSANSAGTYHPDLICQALGYTTADQWGGTCGNVCGYCEGPTSCDATGSYLFDLGAWNGQAYCGNDGLGPLICYTVMWTCV
ncbi:MAG: DUF4215 domain-containing protein [Nannocystaceae bacterium]|nr:DUF4215 domain-containing protein [Nannocystaceae bacterium]